jgi:hypothetical protein
VARERCWPSAAKRRLKLGLDLIERGTTVVLRKTEWQTEASIDCKNAASTWQHTQRHRRSLPVLEATTAAKESMAAGRAELARMTLE